jgi:hypothetical protein
MNTTLRINRVFIVCLPPLVLLAGLLLTSRREPVKAGTGTVAGEQDNWHESKTLVRENALAPFDVDPINTNGRSETLVHVIDGRNSGLYHNFKAYDTNDPAFTPTNAFRTNASSELATAAVRCVHPTGDYGCHTTIQAAVNAGISGDVIHIATGTYTGTFGPVVNISSKNLDLIGGWASDFSTRDPKAYVSTIDGEDQRMAIWFSTSNLVIDGLNFINGNDASGGVSGELGTITISNCTFYNNYGSDGGAAISLNEVAAFTFTNNIIQGNISGPLAAGGAVAISRSSGSVIGNTMSDNTGAPYRGGGIYINGSPLNSFTVTITGNIIHNNSAELGGGVYLRHSNATLDSNTITSNTASIDGGGVYQEGGGSALVANVIRSNTANQSGGGVFLSDADDLIKLDNNIIADNRASIRGTGLFVDDSSPQLRHNTVANNKGGDGSGLFVAGTSTRTLALTNTILFSHSVGIVLSAGDNAVFEATLWGNDTDWSGPGTIFIGGVNVWGDHDFVDPQNGDYHVGPHSAALDAGVDSDVTTDIDGEVRPQGFTFDIGADERPCTGLTDVEISGKTIGYTGINSVFTATVAPEDSSYPITYSWSASGQYPSSGPSDTIAYSWIVTGTKTITVTAGNCGGVSTANHAITVELMISTQYMPLVMRSFTGGPTPPIDVVEAPDTCPGYPGQAGKSYRENIDFANDNDWFAFDAVAGRSYVIETGDLGATADTVLYLWTGDCRTQLAENDDRAFGDPSSWIEWTATETGPLAAMVRNYDWQVYGPETGYTLIIGEQ